MSDPITRGPGKRQRSPMGTRTRHAAPAITYSIQSEARGRSRLKVDTDADYLGVTLTLLLGDTTITIKCSPDEAAHLAAGLTAAAEATRGARLPSAVIA